MAGPAPGEMEQRGLVGENIGESPLLSRPKPPGVDWPGLRLDSLDLIMPESLEPKFTLVDTQEGTQLHQSHSSLSGLAEWWNKLPTNFRANVAEAVPAAVGLLKKAAFTGVEEIYWAIKIADVVDAKITDAKKRVSAKIVYALAHPDETAKEIESAVGRTVERVAESTAEIIYTAAAHPERIVVPVVIAVAEANCGPPPGPKFTVEPIRSPVPALTVLPTDQPRQATVESTPLPPKPEATGTSTSVVAGDITPQAQATVKTYSEALVRYMQALFKKTGIAHAAFVDGRANRNNPLVYSFISDNTEGILGPTAQDHSFILNGDLYVGIRDPKTGNGHIYHIIRPDAKYDYMYFDPDNHWLVFYKNGGTPLAYQMIQPSGVGGLEFIPTETSTPTPTVTATPKPIEMATTIPSPAATPVVAGIPIPSATADASKTPAAAATAAANEAPKTPTTAVSATAAVTKEVPKSPTAAPTPEVDVLRPLGDPIFNSPDGLSGFSGEGQSRSDENSKYTAVDGVYKAIINGSPPVQNTDRMHRPYPDIFFDSPYTQDFATEFSVKVGGDLSPVNLGPYQANPWLSLFGAFDDGLKGSSGKRHASLMVNLVGTPGKYKLQTFANADSGTYFILKSDAPIFPLDEWVKVRVEVDFTTRTIKTFQNGRLVTEGPYTASKLQATGFHWGAYANDKITKATVSNNDVSIAPLKK